MIIPYFGSNKHGTSSIKEVELSSGKGLGITVDTNFGRDYFIFSHDNEIKTYEKYQSRANIAGFRTNMKGEIILKFEGNIK